MTRNDDDIFKPKLGRMRSLGNAKAKSYLNRVLHHVSSASASGFGLARSNRFTGSRIGRGNDMLRRYRAGYRFGPASRRVVIKSRIIKLAGRGASTGLAAARAHLRYVQRDGVSKEQQPGQLYDASGDDADGGAFLERSDGDRHQFRFIVSPEDATELNDLKPFVRDLMRTMESDLDTKLDWAAVDHFNTGHLHTHIVLRGRDDQGKDLVIARDYIGHGLRRRASEILTLELGPQTEQEIRLKLERQVDQDRFTDLDRQLVRQVKDGVLDMRDGQEAGEGPFRRALQVGRLRVLERRGLADETAPGRWRLSPTLEDTLRRAGERGDVIKTMHRCLAAAGLDIGAADYSVFDPGDPRTRAIVGSIMGRGLHDELNDGHYIMVDAADGRVHYVALDPRQDMDDLPAGAIVEVQPAERGMGRADRIIAEIAQRNGGIYSPELHRAHEGEASEEYIKSHVRRLEALRRQNIVQRFADGSWEISDNFEDRVAGVSVKRSRYAARVLTLSYLSLDQQVLSNGATWLDRQLVGGDPVGLRGGRFGAEAGDAMRRRQEHLVEQGLAELKNDGVRYRHNLLRLLRQRELVAAGDRLAKETGLSFMENPDGARVEGVYRQSVQLASGKFAVLEKSKEFTLVPWRPVLERQRGKMVGGVVRGSTVSFEFSKGKRMGIG
jgi:type IV secretory pathway VirD2 relaxase